MLYLSLNFHIVTTDVCQQTSDIHVFLIFWVPLSLINYDSTFKILSKIWNGETITAWHSISLQRSRSTEIYYRDMLSNIPVKPYLISHYYNSCLAFSSCHCNSDTNLNTCICIFTSVTTFQQLSNLSNIHLLRLSLHLAFSSIPQ